MTSTAILPMILVAATSLNADQATKIVQDSISDVIEVLRNPELQGKANRAARHSKLRNISNEVIDWTKMAQRSLGVHWRSLNPKQRDQFTNTFKEILASHYLGQLDRFQGEEKVEHTGTEATGKNKLVKMKLISASRAWVPFSFYINEEKKVYDISIEGVSLSNHYRGTFSRMLANDPFEKMMEKLNKKLEVQKRIQALNDKKAQEAAKQ